MPNFDILLEVTNSIRNKSPFLLDNPIEKRANQKCTTKSNAFFIQTGNLAR